MNVWRVGTQWGKFPVFDLMMRSQIVFWGSDASRDAKSVCAGDLIALSEPGTKRILVLCEAGSAATELEELVTGSACQDELSEYFGAWAIKLAACYELMDDEIFETEDYKRFYRIKEDKPSYSTSIKLFEKKEKCERGLQMVNRLVDMLKQNHQVVLTGAPGTGKTYLARQIARSMVLSDAEKRLPEGEIEKLIKDRTKFVQFHPSYDYTDFVEGLRPIQGVDGQVGFRRQDGTFKKLCKAAIDANECGGVDNFDEVWKKFITDLDERHSIDNPLELTTPNGKSTFKVFANRRDNLSLITSGADNVQGSLTRENVWRYYIGNPKDDYWKGYFTGVLSYLADEKNGYGLQNFVRGKSIEPEAAQKFVMIIDEINRGDISKIFGELFYAIDDGYRGPRGRVETQYQNLVEDGDVFADGFYVPENVYIIGTMNDVDRNVESMDFAIRRRFTWEEIKPEDRFDAMMIGLKDSTGAEVPAEIIKQAKERMIGLNAAIFDKKNGLGAAYQIGPSYFAKIKDYPGDAAAKFEALWEHHLKPLLCEYLRGMPNADDTVDKVLKKAYVGGPLSQEGDVQMPEE